MRKLLNKLRGTSDKAAGDGKSTSTGPSHYLIAVSLQHRGGLSLGANRQKLGRSSYHWGILLVPEGSEDGTDSNGATFDASDGAAIDPATGTDLNEDRHWIYRARRSVNPFANGNLLGRVVIGQLDGDAASVDRLEELLRGVPLPVADDAVRTQNCVSWTLGAVEALQAAGLVPAFDVQVFADRALLYGDFCLANVSVHNIRTREEIMQDESLLK